MRDRIMVALDLPDAASARAMARTLVGEVGWVKVGMTLFYAEGASIVRELKEMGFHVFVDLKLHDIPHQVEGASAALVSAGADMFTVHASGGRAMLEGAMRATTDAAARAGVERPFVVAVTILTSLDDAALAKTGWAVSAAEAVRSLATVARNAGCDGVVCSPKEASVMRSLLGPDAAIVTPGIRPAGEASEDQLRVATPRAALDAGASHLVIGRPITAAEDPVSAVRRIVEGARS